MATKLKQNELAIKRMQRNELSWEVSMIWKNGAQMSPPFLPIPPGKQINIARYIMHKYPALFTKLVSAKSFVSRVVKKYKNRPDNKQPFRDKRGENHPTQKRNNQVAIATTDRILCRQKGRPKDVVTALADEGIHMHVSTVRRIMQDLNIHCVKPWYTDILTAAQKYKRLLFANPLLSMDPDELLQVLMAWMKTDEKWFLYNN